MSRFIDIIVIAVDLDDYLVWTQQNPELTWASRAVYAKTWDDVAPSKIHVAAATYVLTERTAQIPGIGGSEPPRWFRVAMAIAESRRPAYLKVAA